MKHAITDVLGVVLRVTDSPSENSREITDDQAALIASGRTAKPPVHYAFYAGQLVPRQEMLDARRAVAVAARLPVARKVTKLTLMRRLDALGKWGTFKAVLASMPETVQDAWALAQEISESDPMFAANRDAIAAAIGLTVDEVGALFA